MRKLLAVLTVLIVLPTFEAQTPAHEFTLRLSRPWYGMVSWYGDQWAGKRTACGEKFDPMRPTVAHPYLPCGTVVRVSNPRTGHFALARVTDRGPYAEGREMDVSAAVAERIDLKRFGVEKIRIEVVE